MTNNEQPRVEAPDPAPGIDATLLDDTVQPADTMRLADGFVAFAGPNGQLSLRLPHGAFVDLPAVEDPQEAIARWRSGQEADITDPRVQTALVEAGVLATPTAKASRVVWLVCECPDLARALTLSSSYAIELTEADAIDALLCADSSDHRPAAVCWFVDGPAPAAWRTHGDRLPGLGIGWIRASREGDLVYVEPPAWTLDDPLHVDVSGRRLAASPSPDHLAHYWSTPLAAGPGQMEGPAVGLCSALLALALNGRHATPSVPTAGVGDGPRTSDAPVLLVGNLCTGAVSSHPILKIPSGEGVGA